MDAIGRIIGTFRAEASSASGARKMALLLELQGQDDGRIVPFLLELLTDPREPTEVRVHALKRVRNGGLTEQNRVRVATSIIEVVASDANANLRLRATIALGEFTDVTGVVAALGGIALDEGAPIDLRYGAFTSLERAGPTPECLSLMRRLQEDEALGRTARGALVAWHALEDKA